MAARWGSFLQQAVNGIESRLDTILADEEEAKKAKLTPAQAPTAAAASTSAPAPVSAKPSPVPSRSGSTSRAQDRLQERLARAVAAKNAASGQKPEPSPSPSRLSFNSSPRQSLDIQSRRSTDSIEPTVQNPTQHFQQQATAALQRTSLDAPDSAGQTQPQKLPLDVTISKGKEEETLPGDAVQDQPRKSTDSSLLPAPPQVEITPAAAEPRDREEAIVKAEQNAQGRPAPTAGNAKEPELSPALTDDGHRQHQEEIHDYVEKIDALEAKLQYLAREAADAAKKAIQSAPPGSMEKKLAEKDQQIALLMEEGKNLGVTEQKHRAIMKKLRAKIAEDEREMNDLRAARAKADADADAMRRKSRRADDMEKFHEESLKRIGLLQKEVNGLRSDVAGRDATISDLRIQLQKAAENAESLTAKVNEDALEKERSRARDLEEQVAALQVEKSLVADRGRAQAADLREKLERATERARVLELEAKAEAAAMEAKLEAMRVRAEETSSGALGDSQAKLLRQVETLQTQYAIAGDNWQGIEATLLARVASLEKERDEALQRESEMRKKAREAAVRAKRNEEELEDVRSKLPTAQEDIKSYQAQLESLRRRAEQAKAALLEARADFDKQRAAWMESSGQGGSRERSESYDRRSWLEDLTTGPAHQQQQQQPHPHPPFRTATGGSNSNSRPESPLLSPPSRAWSSDLLGFQTLSGKLRKPSAPSSNGDAAGSGPAARRPSVQPQTRPSVYSMMQSGGGAAGTSSSNHGGMTTPATHFSASIEALSTPGMGHPLEEQDDMAPLEAGAEAGTETSSNPRQVLQDMVSVSTVAAGPSVQLVERMSAQIRRLESEKVAAREELARMSRQRDEARAEMVSLMREVEGGKTAVDKVKRLEAEVAEVKDRYETTLEMLGEKSELVEELRADVQDVKAMYRDLIERTLK